MKAKKLLSLLSASVMAFSAFATMASADPVTPAPKATFNVTKFTSAEATELGVTLESGEALYYISLNLSDLGPLNYLETGTGLAKKTTGVKITGLKITVSDVDLILLDSENQKLKFDTYSGQIANGMKFEYLDTGKATAYPATKGTSIDNASISDAIGAYVTAPIGTTPTFTEAMCQITTWGEAASYTSAPWYDIAVTSFTFENPEAPTASIGIVIDKTSSTVKENGCIWDCTLTQNNATAEAFTAEFKSGEDKVTKTAENFGTFVNSFGGAGSVEFKVGLKTNKVIDSFKATVTGTEGTSATDTWTPAQ